MVSKQLMASSTRPFILAIISKGKDYDFSIIQRDKETSVRNLEGTDGMLYPVLQRMEVDELISFTWKLFRGNHPRRYCTVINRCKKELTAELVSWRTVWQALSRFSEPLLSED